MKSNKVAKKNNVGKIVMGATVAAAGGIVTAVALKNRKKITTKAKEITGKLSDLKEEIVKKMDKPKKVSTQKEKNLKKVVKKRS